MRDRYQGQDPKSWMLRTHAQTAGFPSPPSNLTTISFASPFRRWPEFMGGTNSLHTNSMDETLALPTDEAVMIALRTQQIIAEESGVANVVDPFGGSYFMESLTNRVERETMEYIQQIDEMGGMVKAVERGFPQAEIANSAYHFQRQLETKEKVMVGVNKYQAEEKHERWIRSTSTGPSRKNRFNASSSFAANEMRRPTTSSAQVKESAQAGQNLMEPIIGAVKAYATLQESVIRCAMSTVSIVRQGVFKNGNSIKKFEF